MRLRRLSSLQQRGSVGERHAGQAGNVDQSASQPGRLARPHLFQQGSLTRWPQWHGGRLWLQLIRIHRLSADSLAVLRRQIDFLAEKWLILSVSRVGMVQAVSAGEATLIHRTSVRDPI